MTRKGEILQIPKVEFIVLFQKLKMPGGTRKDLAVQDLQFGYW